MRTIDLTRNNQILMNIRNFERNLNSKLNKFIFEFENDYIRYDFLVELFNINIDIGEEYDYNIICNE
jgi:hypothetical protein